MDMVSDNCLRRKNSHGFLEECIKSKIYSYPILSSSGSLPSVRLVSERKSTEPFVDFFQGSEAGMLLYVVRRHCSACFQWVLKSRASSSFIPFWASLDSVFVILLMLPAQQCCGFAVLSCCEASVQLSQPLFPALKLWLPTCLLDEVTSLSFSVGTDTLGSRFDPEYVIQTSEFRSVKQD